MGLPTEHVASSERGPLPPRSLRRGFRRALLSVALLTATWGLSSTSAFEARAQEAPAPSSSLSPDLDALAPEPAFVRQHWTADDGLPVDAVNSVLQTQDGYLWIATFDGLVRFDGVRFTVFRASDYPGLTSNRIKALAEDRGGTLWLIDSRGNLMSYHGGVFEHADRLSGRDSLLVNDVDVGPAGRVWFGTNRGLARAVPGEDRSALAAVPEVGAVDVQGLEVGADGTLWLGTARSGLLRLPPGGQPIRHAPWVGLRYVYRSTGGSLAALEWTALGNSGRHPIPEAGLAGPTPVSSPSSDQDVSVRYSDGTLWTWEDHYRLMLEGTVVLETPSIITTVMRDREGNVWVGTESDGLYRLRPSGLQTLGLPEGLALDNVYPILETHSGAVWLGGLSSWLSRLSGGRVTNYEVPFLYVWALHEDRAGALWVGGDGLCTIATPDSPCLPRDIPVALRPADGPAGADVRVVHEDAGGTLWVGSFDGLYRRPRGCQSATCWDHLSDAGLDGLVRSIHEQADGTLWMGSNGAGLIRFMPPGGGRGEHFDTLSTANGFPSNLVRGIHEDRSGVLWIGTEDAGFVRLDPRTTDDLEAMPLTVYGIADGLHTDGIHQILSDPTGPPGGRLWMSTNQGLFWVATRTLEDFHRGDIDHIQTVIYDEDDRMRDREANGGVSPAGMRDRRGRLWFPTQEGAVVVTPSALHPNKTPPPVVIEHVTVGGRTPAVAAVIELAADERNVEIAYTAPVFTDPDEVRFEYQLDGLDRDWTEAGTRRQAFYTNVPAGTYTFRVRAQNGDGVWSVGAASLAFTVAPFVYEVAWFRALAGFLLLALVTVAVRARTRRTENRQRDLERTIAKRTEDLRAEKNRTERQAERLREMDRLKSRFFMNVSHEFRTPLTLTIGPLEDLQSDLKGDVPVPRADAQKNVDLALRNSRRLLRLIGQLLDIAKLEAGELRLDARRGDLAAFVRTTARSFAPLAERRDVRFTVDTPETPVSAAFDAAKMEQVLANLLSNGFKFTPRGGAVHVAVALDASGAALITIRDNGAGIPTEALPHLFERFYQVKETHSEVQQGTGIGLSLAKDFIELHGGTVTVESVVGFGTVFTVRLPVDEALGDEDVVSIMAPVLETPVASPLLTHGDGHSGDDHDEEASDLTAPSTDDLTTVLIADDNAEIRAYVRSHLEPQYRVLEASDGRAALAMARTALPDLIVSDVMMPHLDGFAFVHALRADRETDFIPVVMLTARATDADKVEGLRGGADAYLTKPFSVRELLAHVEGLITSRQRLKERFAATPPPRTVTAVEGHMALSPADRMHLDRARAVVEAHLSDEKFGVDELAAALEQSRSTLYRWLRTTIQKTPNAFIRGIRLDQAATFLRKRSGTVSEVAYAVGFKSVSHFSQAFRIAYGTTPSAYASGRAVPFEENRLEITETPGGTPPPG